MGAGGPRWPRAARDGAGTGPEKAEARRLRSPPPAIKGKLGPSGAGRGRPRGSTRGICRHFNRVGPPPPPACSSARRLRHPSPRRPEPPPLTSVTSHPRTPPPPPTPGRPLFPRRGRRTLPETIPGHPSGSRARRCRPASTPAPTSSQGHLGRPPARHLRRCPESPAPRVTPPLPQVPAVPAPGSPGRPRRDHPPRARRSEAEGRRGLPRRLSAARVPLGGGRVPELPAPPSGEGDAGRQGRRLVLAGARR